MNQATIVRYQRGGDIYQTLATQYGTPAADAIALAAQSGDEGQINSALVQAKYGAPLDTNTLVIFTHQMLTDPLAAPLADANKVLGNSFLSLFKSPWVIVALVIAGFSLMGGWQWLGRKMFQTK
jgi:hypothetical protein